MSTRKLPLRLLCLVVTLGLALLLTGCEEQTRWEVQQATAAAAAPAPEVQEPVFVEHGDFLWQVQNGDSTVYLMGTMHLLRDDYDLNRHVLDLFYASDALAVETNTKDPVLLLADLDQFYYYEDGSSIFDHLSQEGAEYFREVCELYGFNAEAIGRSGLNVDAVGSLFSSEVAEQMDFTADGVDSRLLDLAMETGMPILELEYYMDHLLRVASLDDDTMERVGILSIPHPIEAIVMLENLYDAFLSGDEELMLAFLQTEQQTGYEGLEFQEKDELYNYYTLYERNEIMADSIMGYLSQPGTTFVAAGLAHFLGEGSIVELLEAQGYTVERI